MAQSLPGKPNAVGTLKVQQCDGSDGDLVPFATIVVRMIICMKKNMKNRRKPWRNHLDENHLGAALVARPSQGVSYLQEELSSSTIVVEEAILFHLRICSSAGIRKQMTPSHANTIRRIRG